MFSGFSTSRREPVERELVLRRRPLRWRVGWLWAATGEVLSVTAAGRPSFNLAVFPLFLRPKSQGMVGTVAVAGAGAGAVRTAKRDHAKRDWRLAFADNGAICGRPKTAWSRVAGGVGSKSGVAPVGGGRPAVADGDGAAGWTCEGAGDSAGDSQGLGVVVQVYESGERETAPRERMGEGRHSAAVM